MCICWRTHAPELAQAISKVRYSHPGYRCHCSFLPSFADLSVAFRGGQALGVSVAAAALGHLLPADGETCRERRATLLCALGYHPEACLFAQVKRSEEEVEVLCPGHRPQTKASQS